MRASRRAFTLVELLVVITIIAVIAGLVFAVNGAARKNAQRVTAVNQMRQIGQAIHLHVGEHGTFPGPLWPGQLAQLDPDREGRLVRELAGYLGIEIPSTPTIVDFFVPPAFKAFPGAPDLNEARTYVLNMEVEDGGIVVNPWGSLADDPAGSPLPPAAIPAQAWAMSDADQMHPRVKDAPWKTQTTTTPYHGASRLALFFDGSVRPVTDEELKLPN
jgi:prepilin-type N-terminal cleavage/methylation domain-containing protein